MSTGSKSTKGYKSKDGKFRPAQKPSGTYRPGGLKTAKVSAIKPKPQ